jgi:hypothetical protein
MADKFRIRFATLDDAEIISRHRARMFQDMGELPANLFEAFRASSCDQLRDLLVRSRYLGWLLSLENAPDKIIAGAGVHLRRVLPHPVKNAATFADGRHASANGRALYERLGFVATNEMRFAGDSPLRT